MKNVMRYLCPLIFIPVFCPGNPACAQSAKDIEGIYIVSGGESYLVIESGFWGSLEVREGEIQTPVYFHRPPKTIFHSLDLKNDTLHLVQEERYEDGNDPYDYNKVTLSFTLKTSPDLPGDWDLVDGEIRCMKIPINRMFSKKFFEDLYYSYSLEDLKEDFISYLPKGNIEKVFHYKWDAARGRLPSFLHRVDDSHIMDYYRLRQNGIINENTFQLARDLSISHPNDPYVMLLLAEMEALKGNPSEASILCELCRESLKFYPDPILEQLTESVFHTVCIQKNKKIHPDQQSPWDFFKTDYQGRGGKHNLKETMEYYKNYLDSGNMFFISQEIVPPLKVPGYFGGAVPNFLEIQVSSKALQTLATFYLFQGRRKESLELLASVYRMGQSLNAHGTFIQRLIGMGVRRIASGGLKIFVLNACETKDDFHECCKTLEMLHNTPFQEDGTRLYWGEFPPLISLMEEVLPGGCSYMRTPEGEAEAIARQRMSDMEFQLVRMAAAAKYRLLLSGDFPNSESDFSPFLPNGLPKDEFTTGTHLRFAPLSKNEFVIYSLGPDKDDDKSSLEYDPTNGTMSNGDISLKIPREREFPFPREPVHAANAFKLLEQFPNGLPRDPFNHQRNQPLNILEATKTEPVVIFSLGPDMDDIYIHRHGYFKESSKESGDKFEPVSTPDPGQNPSSGRLLQKVFRRAEKIPLKPGSWLLDPLYDPTNGTVTNGDLFIEIPGTDMGSIP